MTEGGQSRRLRGVGSGERRTHQEGVLDAVARGLQ